MLQNIIIFLTNFRKQKENSIKVFNDFYNYYCPFPSILNKIKGMRYLKNIKTEEWTASLKYILKECYK
jgi:hypothetical protein